MTKASPGHTNHPTVGKCSCGGIMVDAIINVFVGYLVLGNEGYDIKNRFCEQCVLNVGPITD